MTRRRDFIKKSVLGTAGLTISSIGLGAGSYNSVIGANERINLAVIGCGGRGGSLGQAAHAVAPERGEASGSAVAAFVRSIGRRRASPGPAAIRQGRGSGRDSGSGAPV